MSDASFADGAEMPVRLQAFDAEGLTVIAALCQDAVAPVGEFRFLKGARRFVGLVNRFRWEAEGASERVRALLVIDGVTGVRGLGIDPADADTVLSLLTVIYEGPEEGPGVVRLTFAGDGEIAVSVEALEVRLHDATLPYEAVSGRAPAHE